MLPKDANLLFSILNTYLRDKYASLDALCDDLEEDRSALEDLMAKAGYVYDAARNAFGKGAAK